MFSSTASSLDYPSQLGDRGWNPSETPMCATSGPIPMPESVPSDSTGDGTENSQSPNVDVSPPSTGLQGICGPKADSAVGMESEGNLAVDNRDSLQGTCRQASQPHQQSQVTSEESRVKVLGPFGQTGDLWGEVDDEFDEQMRQGFEARARARKEKRESEWRVKPRESMWPFWVRNMFSRRTEPSNSSDLNKSDTPNQWSLMFETLPTGPDSQNVANEQGESNSPERGDEEHLTSGEKSSRAKSRWNSLWKSLQRNTMSLLSVLRVGRPQAEGGPNRDSRPKLSETSTVNSDVVPTHDPTAPLGEELPKSCPSTTASDIEAPGPAIQQAGDGSTTQLSKGPRQHVRQKPKDQPRLSRFHEHFDYSGAYNGTLEGQVVSSQYPGPQSSESEPAQPPPQPPASHSDRDTSMVPKHTLHGGNTRSFDAETSHANGSRRLGELSRKFANAVAAGFSRFVLRRGGEKKKMQPESDSPIVASEAPYAMDLPLEPGWQSGIKTGAQPATDGQSSQAEMNSKDETQETEAPGHSEVPIDTAAPRAAFNENRSTDNHGSVPLNPGAGTPSIQQSTEGWQQYPVTSDNTSDVLHQSSENHNGATASGQSAYAETAQRFSIATRRPENTSETRFNDIHRYLGKEIRKSAPCSGIGRPAQKPSEQTQDSTEISERAANMTSDSPYGYYGQEVEYQREQLGARQTMDSRPTQTSIHSQKSGARLRKGLSDLKSLIKRKATAWEGRKEGKSGTSSAADSQPHGYQTRKDTTKSRALHKLGRKIKSRFLPGNPYQGRPFPSTSQVQTTRYA